MRRQIAIIVLLLTLVSCRKDPSQDTQTAGTSRVTFHSVLSLEIGRSSTKATQILPENATLKASAFKRVNTSAADITTDTWIDSNSYVIQANGSAIPTLVNDDGTVKEGEATDMELNNGTYDFYAHSPALKIESDNHTIKGIPHYMDFMSAVVSGKAVNRSSSEVALTFEHACSKIQFQVKSATGMTTDSLTADSVILYKMATTPAADYTLGGDITPSVGAVTDTCLLSQIVPATDGKSVSVWNILLPKSTETFGGDFHVKVNGTPYVLKAKDIPAMSFSKGNHYLFTALVKQGSVSLVLDVVSWNSVSGSHTPGQGGQVDGGSWGQGGGTSDVGTENSLVIGNWDNVSWGGGIGGNFDWIDGSLVVSSWKPIQFPVEAGSGSVHDVNSWVAKTLSAQAGSNNSGLVDNWGGSSGGTGLGTQTESANCYMVTPGQSVTFNACVQGNGGAGAVAMNPASVQVLWQTGDGVTPLIRTATLNGGMATVTPTAGKVGSAVVAAYSGANGTGTILWSWHIWVTDYKPEGQASVAANTAYNVGGGQVHTYGTQFLAKNPGKVIMDRNLGATAAVYAPPADVAVGAKTFGFFYQWGRKDPMPQWDGVGMNNFTAVAIKIYAANGTTLLTEGAKDNTTATGFKKVSVATAGSTPPSTLTYATKNPLSFIYATVAPDDWYTTAADNSAGNGLWGGGAQKSAYDPCPVGWRVPSDGTWTDFGTRANAYTAPFFFYINGVKQTANGTPALVQSGRNGRFYEPSSGTVRAWYPAPGTLTLSNGQFWDIGDRGYSWSSTVSGINGLLLWLGNGSILPSNAYGRAYGCQVRCVQE